MSRAFSLAGFEVTLIGRFWVTTEDCSGLCNPCFLCRGGSGYSPSRRRETDVRKADLWTKCFWTSPAGDDYGRSFSYSGIQLRVDSKPSHSVYECSPADTQSDCSAIRTAYAALARGKRLYDFLALLPFVLLSAGVDIRS